MLSVLILIPLLILKASPILEAYLERKILEYMKNNKDDEQ